MLYNSIKWLFDWSKNEANEELVNITLEMIQDKDIVIKYEK